MRKITKEERSAAVDQLRSELHAGQEILVLTTRVSASGMSRNLRFFYAYTDDSRSEYYNDGQLLGGHAQRTTPFVDRGRGNGRLRDITWFVVKSGALSPVPPTLAPGCGCESAGSAGRCHYERARRSWNALHSVRCRTLPCALCRRLASLDMRA